MDAIEALTSRRSPPKLVDPPPSDEQIAAMLDAPPSARPTTGGCGRGASSLLRGAARERLGTVLADALKARAPDVPEDVLRARAPEAVARAARSWSSPRSLVEGHKIPVIEQMLAAGAAAQNILLAAHAMGFGAMWRTGEPRL